MLWVRLTCCRPEAEGWKDGRLMCASKNHPVVTELLWSSIRTQGSIRNTHVVFIGKLWLIYLQIKYKRVTGLAPK